MASNQYYVLHLDDNDDFPYILRKFFEKENIIYQHVKTVQIAFDCLEERLPHLLLVDLMLEDDMNPEPGINFIKDAYQKYPGLKMMVLSNLDRSNIREELEDYIIGYELKIHKSSVLVSRVIKRLKEMEFVNGSS